MTRHLLHICVLISTLFFGCSKHPEKTEKSNATFELLSEKQIFTAGEAFSLDFKTSGKSNAVLAVRNAIGTTILSPSFSDGILQFSIPKNFHEKSGPCYWSLFSDSEEKMNGTVNIHINPRKGTFLESYLGPRSLTAGPEDYAMFVMVPTDIYDNPLNDSTSVFSKIQFQDRQSESELFTKNLMAWSKVRPPTKSGRMLISAACNETDSKEFTTIVYPANPIDFTTSYERNHEYADGNQVITFKSSILKDTYGNIVSDGTLVSFIITDEKGAKLKAQGTTLNGMAQARLLHPEHQASWSIEAFVTGAAKSKLIKVDFKASVTDYNLRFSEDHRSISVGPLKSFMNQLVPDGMPISLTVKDNKGNILDLLRTSSMQGKGQFELSRDFYPNDTYLLLIKTAGITKTKSVALK
ncbi:hypothetical protein [Zobellia galactanivorans]|uniref:Conserved hypothetical lipoprotein n=1 Tax=Zobellia galactanivorans (strain DSM 12802 / CCUG 47099 / CIP 106680 / NCIMB 13871 / Dsij) TaxID=63186 RepID=G0KZR4_ZOBGA|nr:hypothetical protein [Zobellia galactanivorans]MBU3025101.1 hypothetical protein [Zobellia galactanivorans]CAZ97133.1 Conserved hypothetical lipoprotein [Zobellia galactanivorans]